jgi:uncharacterized Fe-S cluster-containing protein
VVCPQNAKQIVDSTEKAKVLIQSGAPVAASVAPSFIANFGAGIKPMREALMKLGFADAEETAIGATIVKREYEKLLREGREVLISSCCHSANLLIQKHFPHALPYLADVVSPMQAHALDIKRRKPDSKVVFIGPCVAKKDEADYYGTVDAALTFEELAAWLLEKKVFLEKSCDSDNRSRARLFPTAGGILKAMDCDSPDHSYLFIDGVENCIAALRDIESGKLGRCFIEMSACSGSCIGGPAMSKRRLPVKDYIAVSSCAGDRDFDVKPLPDGFTQKSMTHIAKKLRAASKAEISEVLRQMGKFKRSDELNCGSCGYDTCRDKALAIFQGKADLSMCLPFLKDRAENFSDNIINNSPNGILVLNDSLEVQRINRAALGIINARSGSDVLGEPVVRILDPADFTEAKESGGSTKRAYLAEYGKHVDQTIIYDSEYKIIICFMKDVTEEENDRGKKSEFARRTVETADKVVDKQMRLVQEIASLLGETVAETKVALTKLKGAVMDE